MRFSKKSSPAGSIAPELAADEAGATDVAAPKLEDVPISAVATESVKKIGFLIAIGVPVHRLRRPGPVPTGPGSP